MIVAPDGTDAWAPTKPRPDESLIRALARARRWKRSLDEGRHRSAREIAEAEKIMKRFVNRLIPLTFLAPDIEESVLDERQSKGLQLVELTCVMPNEWWEQRVQLDRPHPREGRLARNQN